MRGLALIASAFALAGCSLQTMALRSTAGLLVDGAKTYYGEPDATLAREAMGPQLKLVEALLENEPGNLRLLALASQGFGGYAHLFLEDDQPERAKTFYLRGRDYGLRLLARQKAYARVLAQSPSELEDALRQAARADVPALFWTAYCWAGWVNLSRDSSAAVADLPKAALMMKRVNELWPEYYFAGSEIFFGVYYASRPKMLGGDPEKAKTHFERAHRVNGGKFLTAHLLEARYYAVAAQDQELFKSLLAKVKESEAGALPESRLADEVAKKKAAALLEKINDYF